MGHQVRRAFEGERYGVRRRSQGVLLAVLVARLVVGHRGSSLLKKIGGEGKEQQGLESSVALLKNVEVIATGGKAGEGQGKLSEKFTRIFHPRPLSHLSVSQSARSLISQSLSQPDPPLLSSK